MTELRVFLNYASCKSHKEKNQNVQRNVTYQNEECIIELLPNTTTNRSMWRHIVYFTLFTRQVNLILVAPYYN